MAQGQKGGGFFPEVMRNRLIFNSQQMLLATYLISGITKLSTSGLGWVADSPNISVQIYKAQMAMYNSLEWGFFKDLATLFSDLSADYPWLVQLTFAGALCLELFCFLALLNRRISKVVGSLLLTMHIGIFVLFGVFFIPFFVLVILLLIGPGKGRKRVARS